MNSAVTKKSDTETTITVSLDQEALEPIVRQTFNKLRSNVKAAGFRPGKAPDHIVERELGTNALQSEVLEAATQRSYVQALQQHNLAAVAPPRVSLTKFVPYSQLEYTATVEVLPPVRLADYKKMRLRRPQVKVESSEVDRALEDLRFRLAERKKVARPSRQGDEVILDFEGRHQGERVPGASGKNYTLRLGSGQFVPGFEDQVMGTASGQNKKFQIKFHNDYPTTEIAGREVDFDIILIEVSELELPTLDDGLAAKIGPFKSLKELKADVEQHLRAEKTEQAGQQFESQVLDEVIKKSQFKVPPSLVHQQVHRLLDEMAQNLSYHGLDLPKYLKTRGQSEADLEKELEPKARERVELAVVLNEIAKAENVSVTPQEVAAEFDNLQQRYGDSMSRELKEPKIREDIYNHLLASRTIAKILEYVENK